MNIHIRPLPYHLIAVSLFILGCIHHSFGQVQLSNGSPTATLDFSASMPASVATNPASSFAGVGYSPNPVEAGRLNSNAWAVTGWSNGALAFGGTQVTANTDYTRGSASAAVSTGGMYAYTGAPQSIANPCLMIQPGGSDWAPGTLTLRIENTGTTNITELEIAYNIYIRNDQARSNSFDFSYSADDITYTQVPALDYTSPAASDMSGWILVGTAPSRTTLINGLNVAPGDYYYIRWSGADVGGSGSRDEFGLDDIELNATFAAPPGGNCTIICPENITIECDESILPANTGEAIADDSCDPATLITYEDIADLSGCGDYTGTITRTWTGEESGGNTVTCEQTITIEDTTPPTWDTDPLPADITVECDAIPDPEDLEATDNCASVGGGMNVVFINELHYDNTGADVNEFVEIAGTAGLDLTGYTIVWYNGSNGQSYGTTNLSGVLPDEGLGGGALAFFFAGIQNGAPDGLALVDPSNTVLQFLSYEGTFMATNGPANGMMSEDIGVSENGSEPVGLSLQLIGTGSDYPDFIWTGPSAESPGLLNDGQEFLGMPGQGVEITFTEIETEGNCDDQYTLTRTWTATDPCNNAITHTQVITVVDTTPPVWTSNLPVDEDAECDNIPGIQVLTVQDNCDTDVDIQFNEVRTNGNCPHNYTLTRTWTATDNCDNAITHTQVITVEDSTPPVWDQDPLPQDLTIACGTIPSPEELTAMDNCTGGMVGDVLFFNEIHYDNAGTDVGEFIELAGSAGLDLLGYSIVLYNGSNGQLYNTLNLSGTIPDEGNGTGTLVFNYPSNGIQNGAPDGLALVQGASVLYFLSYEGAFMAVDGPAAGMMSVDIGVAQEPAPAVGLTLQLIGTGTDYDDFTWVGPVGDSPGTLNDGQNFSLPVPSLITYTFNEDFTPGACLGEGVITRTWTAEDACGNEIVHTQMINLIDDVAPMFNPMLADITVECDAIPPADEVEAVDGCGPTAGIQPWINEIHYDNIGTDQDEFFEIAGPAGLDLANYTVYLYNGANGLVYDTRPLSGIISNEGKGYGAIAFFLPVNGLQNGSPDGLAIVQNPGTVVQFLSYEGTFTAVDGPAIGQTSTNIGVAQEPSPAIELSLQLTGTGSQYSDFNWVGPVANSPGNLNADQLVGPVLLTVTLNEVVTPGACIGEQTITRTYSATDDCGNEALMTQVITVEDNTPPIALCNNATIYLDENGEATLDPLIIDNGSSDNCSPVTFTLSQSLFFCSDGGENTVTLFVRDACANEASCTAIVTVLDTIPPTLNCPGSRIINLDPGLCCAIVSWAEPTATDNCPFVGPVTSLLQECTYTNYWTGWALDLVNLTAGPMNVSGIQVQAGLAGAGAGIYNLRAYMRTGSHTGNTGSNVGWTEVGNVNVLINAGFPTNLYYEIPFSTAFTIPANSTSGLYVVANNGANSLVRVVANVLNTTPTEDANLRISQNPSTWVNGLFGGNAFNENPRPWLRVDYQTGGEPKVIQTGGPLSGTELCKDDSPWVVSYEVEDVAGNLTECSFTIEVNEYANPVSNLNCNDQVQFSLGEDCDTRVGADDILEGGPYGCYDDYIVTVMGPNGQPLPSSPFVGNAQIGNCYTVKVTDPTTGNSCWGSICVEDKMPPVLVCTDLTLNCADEIPLAPSPAFFSAQAPLQFPESFLQHGGGTAFTLSGNTLPGGVYFNVTNNSAEPLQITGFGLRFGNPAFGQVNPPQTMEVYTKPGTYAGFEVNAAAWTNLGPQVITDIPPHVVTGTGPLAQLPIAQAQTLAPGETRAFHVFGATACPVFNYFNGTAPVTNGPFTVTGGPVSFGLLSNLFQAGASSMPNIQINWAIELEAMPVTDNCTNEIYMNTIGQGLQYGEEIINYTCAQNAEIFRTINRVWTATDLQGNSTQCVQTIDIKRSSLSTIELPANFDDLEEVSFDCKDQYPTPDYINQQRGFGGYPSGLGCGSLNYVYTDKVLEVCQGSYTIIRTWTLHDMCTGEIGTHDQVIKVIDKTPPVLFCPSEHDIKFNALQGNNYGECKVNVKMPWTQVTDDCSTTNNLNVYVWTTLPDGTVVIQNQQDAQGYFNFELDAVPAPFQYLFRYVAIDDCGNKSECAILVAVRDKTPPVVVCETLHTVSLTDSITFVNAISFDDGSYDECGNITFDARRGTMNTSGAFVNHPCNLPGDNQYQPAVRFYCCDALSDVPLFVDLRVRDASGNVNNCMVPVTVVDKVRPVIWCPEDITVQCGMPFEPTDLDTFDICKQPNMVIKDAFAGVYTFPIDIFGIPADAKITDLDLSLNIEHALTNQLRVTLYSPLNRKAEVLTPNSCAGQPVQYPWNIDVTFNDQAYNINVFNSTGQKVAAPFTCTTAKPSIGAFNQGQMKPQGDELKIFNGQPLNSFTNKFLCYTASTTDIDVATNRISNFQVQSFILNAGLIPGDRILMEYASATGQNIEGLEVGSVYLFQVINNNTIELLTVTGADIISVAAGTQHMFCASGTWLLVVEDTAPLAGGIVNEFCMHIEYELPTGLKPHVSDNTEECGLEVTHQDLGTPENCADGTFINRRWRVDDAFNNNTTCIQRVYFTDDTPLTVQFPCDVTVDCDELDDLEATGDVLHNGDCEIVGVEHQDHVLVTTDACYKILRTWIVKDWCSYQADGNIDYPTTSINTDLNEITFSTALNALINSRRIDLGDRVTLRYVTSGTTEIQGMVEGDIYSMVRVSGTTFRVDYNTTKQQAVSITGQGVGPHIFRYANSDLGLPLTCDVLVEWYPFVDWYTACCNPIAARRAWENDGDGYFKFVQEIKVIDEEAPQWVDCSDKDFCSFEADCGPTQIELICPATDNCTPDDQLEYTYFIDAFNDGTVDITGVGNDASGAYPLGTHKITYKVTDQCGNWNTCTKLFTISDCKKPTPICINGLSVELMPTGMVEVWASSFEAGDSHDNCTEYPNLTILVERLSEITPGQEVPGTNASDVIKFSCDDRPPVTQTPIVKVAVWVCDEAGNCDYCITEVWVQANMGPCGSTMSTELMAHLVTESSEGIQEVEVSLTDQSGMNTMQVSNETGWTNFGMVPGEGSYTVSPHKDILPLNGVSTYDLLLIQKHLLGVKSINSPYKLIAADANNSCSVTISDIIEIRKMILSPGLNFTNNTSWRFVDANYAFPEPAKPCLFPEINNLQSIMDDEVVAQFIGVKIGDVSGDALPNSLVGGESRSSVGTLSFSIADEDLNAGETYEVAIKAKDFVNIQGYQYTMDFNTDVVDFVDVTANWSELHASNFGRAKVNEGILTTSWNSSKGVTLNDDEVLYTVTFRAKAGKKLSEVLTVNSRVTRAEAYDQHEELLEVNFRFDGGITTGGGFALYQNEPNPFRDVTVIGFNLPASTQATLTVYDMTGKVLHEVSGDYCKGYNAIHLNRADIRGNGMLYYSLETTTDKATKRMILID